MTGFGSRAAVFDWLIGLLFYAPVRRDNPFGKRPPHRVVLNRQIPIPVLQLSLPQAPFWTNV